MKRPAKWLWPDTVASRAILILVAALLAFHLLGYWAYRVSVENLATLGQDRGLAERIVSIKRVIAGLPEAPDRDRVAHDLSSASLEVHWSKVSLVLGSAPGTERTRTMEARLKTLAPNSPRNPSGWVSPTTERWVQAKRMPIDTCCWFRCGSMTVPG